MYYNPEVFGILPYRHSYTQTGEETISAFFLPCFKSIKDLSLLDKRGFISDQKGKEYFDKIRATKASDPEALITYMAEYCYNAEEAFSLEGENKFNKVAISEQLALIRLHKKGRKIKSGYLDYTYKNSVHSEDNITGLVFKENPKSKLKILQPPIWECEPLKDEDGKVIWNPPSEKVNNLYVIGIDSIDIGAQDTSSSTKNPSDFCVTVKKRAYGLQEPEYVCIYKDRPEDIREAYKIAIKIAQWYNAVINIEATRMNMISWARDHHYLKFFMKRPSATYADPTKRNSKQYGSPATVAVIDHQTTLIADYVNDYCHNIWFEEMLDELNRYTDENKTKFDIIASMGMAELADEELHDVSPKFKEDKKQSFKDIGYYIDERGIKRFGIINKTPYYETRNNNNWIETYDIRRKSNPRY